MAAATINDMHFESFPPPATVDDIVREFWVLEDEGRLHAGLPKPYVEIVVSLAGVHWWRSEPHGTEYRYDDAWVTPLQLAPRYARSDGRRKLIGARMEPLAAKRRFGLLVPGNGDPPPRLAHLVGEEAVERLRDGLIAASSNPARLAHFARWLEGLPERRAGARPTPVGDQQFVATLARRMAVTARTLRRHFRADLGIAPKRWLVLNRIDKVLRDPALAREDETLAALAQDHGYADQAHFTREVARITGVTPGQLRRRPPGVPPHLMPGD